MRAAATRILLSLLLAACFDWVLVHVAFDSNWTGLFCVGDAFRRPVEMQTGQYILPKSSGYDGQFYQLIAHDPVFARHYDQFVDAPRLRYRRILVPGLAFLLSFGQDPLINWTYIFICWATIGLGVFWLGELAADAGRSSWWGLVFLIVPATLVGLERMTVDVALSALVAACVLALQRGRWISLWIACAAALLAKETGLLVIIAVVASLAREKQFRLAALMTTSALPGLAWFVFVQVHTRGDFTTSDLTPFALVASVTPPLTPGVANLVYRIASIVAAAALAWSAARSILVARRDGLRHAAPLICLLFAVLLFGLQSRGIWEEPNGYTRIYSPLIVALIAATWTRGLRQTLIGLCAITLPSLMQLSVHIAGPLLRPYLHL